MIYPIYIHSLSYLYTKNSQITFAGKCLFSQKTLRLKSFINMWTKEKRQHDMTIVEKLTRMFKPWCPKCVLLWQNNPSRNCTNTTDVFITFSSLHHGIFSWFVRPKLTMNKACMVRLPPLRPLHHISTNNSRSHQGWRHRKDRILPKIFSKQFTLH